MPYPAECGLRATPPETTEAFGEIDPAAFYDNLLALRAAVDEEMAAAQAESSADGSSSSAASPAA